MYQKLIDFWHSIVVIFVPDSAGTRVFNIYHRYVANGYDASSNIRGSGSNVTALCNVLAFGTLIALSVFLFYQVYKLIHALIGGVYE